jgi:NAD(P)-dependent dehydrogenase (short-subunit alcohol dehydrogenase family)
MGTSTVQSKGIVITGASDGIGAAAARWLSAAGRHAVIAGRSQGKTEAVGRELGAEFYLAYLTRLSLASALADKLLEKYLIDVLANNAGGVFSNGATSRHPPARSEPNQPP